jgi:hypothetical protein
MKRENRNVVIMMKKGSLSLLDNNSLRSPSTLLPFSRQQPPKKKHTAARFLLLALREAKDGNSTKSKSFLWRASTTRL